MRIDRTYQLNFGGNTDFLNMLERERLESKKISKTGAVTSMIPYDIGKNNIHVGPSDYVPWLTDRKFCYIKMEGTTFGEVWPKMRPGRATRVPSRNSRKARTRTNRSRGARRCRKNKQITNYSLTTTSTSTITIYP